MADFASLRRNSGAALNKLNDELNKLANPQTSRPSEDDRFWKPEVDKAGNGYAVIRFLPQPANEDVPFVRLFDHAFKGPGGQWLIDGCLTTVGEKCPVCEHNSALWSTGTKDNQAMVRTQKRKLSFIANIYVVKDPSHPENEGKVFLFKFGKKIFDKLNAAMNPEFEDEQPLNPFDFWSGANFKLKIRKVEGYQNYDKSEFDDPAPLLDDDEKLERLWKQEYPLQPFLDRSKFKSYDDLKARLAKVLALDGMTASAPVNQEIWPEEKEVVQRSAPAPKIRESEVPWDEQEDDDLAMFQKLAND